MKAVGIIAEYNPFHYGHAYQLAKVKETVDSEIIIVLMSGNIVQRGEFAILDKWQRAQIALNYGADLVIELPALASLQSADNFGRWGVNLLAELGCQELAFGVEDTSIKEMEQFLDWYQNQEMTIEGKIRGYLASGMSYPASIAKSIENASQEAFSFNPSSPNNLLGRQYLRTNKTLDYPMKAYAINRLTEKSTYLLSASSIRKAYIEEQLTMNQVPQQTFLALSQNGGVIWEDYWTLLKYKLLSTHTDELAMIWGYQEGIENRIQECARISKTYVEFIGQVMTKRWPKARLNRMMMASLLNIKQSDWSQYENQLSDDPHLRVLAFNKMGQNYLSQLNKMKPNLTFSNLTQSIMNVYQWQYRFDEIYELNTRINISRQNNGRFPILGD